MTKWISISEYYELGRTLIKHEGFSWCDINTLYPFEREFLINLLVKEMKQKE